MTDYAEKVRQIRQRFLRSFEQRLDGIEQARSQVVAGNTDAMAALHLRLHDFSGNAAMLGLDDIAQEARRSLDAIERTDTDDAAERSRMLSDLWRATLRIKDLKRNADLSE